MNPTPAEAIATGLAAAGVRYLFGMPGGGNNLDVIGACAAAGIDFVLAHTETAAAITASAYAELIGTVGVRRDAGTRRGVGGQRGGAGPAGPAAVAAALRHRERGRPAAHRPPADRPAGGVRAGDEVVGHGRFPRPARRGARRAGDRDHRTARRGAPRRGPVGRASR